MTALTQAALVSLDLVRTHLRISTEQEDTLLAVYIAAAGDYIRNFLNQAIPGLDDSPQDVPSAIISACLLFVGDLYANREAQSETVLTENKAAINLLYPYRINIGI